MNYYLNYYTHIYAPLYKNRTLLNTEPNYRKKHVESYMMAGVLRLAFIQVFFIVLLLMIVNYKIYPGFPVNITYIILVFYTVFLLVVMGIELKLEKRSKELEEIIKKILKGDRNAIY